MVMILNFPLHTHPVILTAGHMGKIICHASTMLLMQFLRTEEHDCVSSK